MRHSIWSNLIYSEWLSRQLFSQQCRMNCWRSVEHRCLERKFLLHRTTLPFEVSHDAQTERHVGENQPQLLVFPFCWICCPTIVHMARIQHSMPVFKHVILLESVSEFTRMLHLYVCVWKHWTITPHAGSQATLNELRASASCVSL